MESLKYKVIKTKKQYNEYCSELEILTDTNRKDKKIVEEIELLTLLIETWDKAHNTLDDVDPITLLKYLMEERGMKPKDLVELLGVNKSLVSEILNYKKGLSKEIIRKLSTEFKVSQEAFNRPYKLKSPLNINLKNESVMNTPKRMSIAH